MDRRTRDGRTNNDLEVRVEALVQRSDELTEALKTLLADLKGGTDGSK